MYRRYSSRRLAAFTALAAGASVLTALPAARAQADTVGATVTVTAALTLALTGSVSLTGAPGDTPVQVGAVQLVVTTNNLTGYNVTVTPDAIDLVGAPSGTIPFNSLQVLNTAIVGSTTLDYTSLTFPTPLTIHNQATPSAPTGDAFANNYRITIPAGAAPGAYTGTITYLATANS